MADAKVEQEKAEDGQENAHHAAPSKNSIKVKRGEYQVHIYLEEARGLVPNKEGETIDPVVTFTIFGQTKFTKPKDDISAGSVVTWGEHIFFTSPILEVEEVESQKILIEVRDHRFMLKDSLIGLYELDLMYVYYQEKHAVVHQWIALCNAESKDFQTVRGHIKVGICVQSEGDEGADLTAREEKEPKDSDTLMPPQVIHKSCQLIVRIIKAEGLPKLDIANGTIDAFCQLEFGGASIKTSIVTADKNFYSSNWYEDLYVPVTLPSVSNKLTIRVLDHDPMNKDDQVGSLIFKWDDIEAGKYSDYFWSNIYGAQKDLSNEQATRMNNNPDLASNWRGRILMKMEVTNPEKPCLDLKKIEEKGINDFIRKNYEIETTYEIRAQVYTAVGLSTACNKYSVVVSWSGKEVETKTLKPENGKCDWFELLKRKTVKIPGEATKTLPDIMVFLKYEDSHVCFARLNPYDWQDLKGEARWIAMCPEKSIGKIKNDWEGGYILLRLYIGAFDDESENLTIGRWNVPPRIKNKQSVTLIINLYQCRSLPIADSDGESDPYIKVYCYGNEVKSTTKMHTLNPMWYETLQLKFEIMSMKDNPPIVIYVFDEDQYSADDLIGMCVVPLQESAIDYSDAAAPEWRPLSLGKTNSNCGEILVSFNLYKREDAQPEYNIFPKCIETIVEINCLGLRDLVPALGWLPINKAFVKFDMNSLQVPGENLMIRNIETQPSEPGRNPNISSIVKFDCKMPVNKLFCPTLSCNVYDNLFKGLSQPLIGTFAINLGEIYHKSRAKRRSKKKHPLEEDKEIDTREEKNDLIPVRMRKPTVAEAVEGKFVIMPEYEVNSEGKPIEMNQPCDSYIQLGYDRKAGDNIMHYRYICDDELENTDYIDKCPFEKFSIKRGQDKGVEDNWLLMLSANKDKEGNYSTLKETGIFKGLIRVSRKSKEEEREARKTMEHKKTDLITGRLAKSGKLAYTELAAAVLSKKMGKEEMETEDSDEEELEHFESVRKMLLVKTQVIVRLYIIDAMNLAQKDWKSNSDPYLRIKLQDQVIDDSENFQEDEPNPKFWKVVDLKTTLPGASRIKIQVWDKDNVLKDDKIGTTIIDLEDRYFSTKWRNLKEKPIETRTLTHPSTKIIQGQIRLWLEMFSTNEAPAPWDISPRPPTAFEVRLVVWQTKGVASYDTEDTSDLYVRAWINDEHPKETDTHYRCQNGKGSFNWRMKFPLLMPRDNCYANIQIWDRDMLSANDFIGDASFSFSELAKKAFEKHMRVKKEAEAGMFDFLTKNEKDKIWLPCKRRKDDGSFENVGNVLVSFEIIPKEKAEACKVGEGRDEPNVDPYLPPPFGRFKWSWNPITLINQTCGPEFRAKICCAFCCILCCYICIMILPMIIGSIAGNASKKS
ncbi:unnamed protein product [Blepharisma stoltei]|uniref:C2 domain-containing protein n=1 Tax=Blepharisma stoltei TaxID=1481888 RepID=A0AAU9K5T3_9CILI|nr:unnamed protein product [Blepharisma stoltei]